MLSVAVPTVLPLTLSVKTTLHEPDVVPHVATYLSPDPATVAMCFVEHVLSLKVKTPPFGPVVLTAAVGMDAHKLTEHGITETPWSFLQIAASIGLAKGCICETLSAPLDEVGGADPAPAHPASRPATARAANGRSND
jgi:hypothetical protein